MFPASSRGHRTKHTPRPSPSPRHLGGVGGSLDGLGRRQNGFDGGGGGNKQPDRSSSHQHANASFAVPQTETATESSPSTEEGETPRRSSGGGGGDDGSVQGLDDNGSATTRTLVDDNDLINELDGALDVAATDAAATAVAVEEGEQTEDGVDAGEGSAVVALPGRSQDRAGVLQGEPQSTAIMAGSTDNVAGDCGRVTGDFVAETEGEAEPRTRQNGTHCASQPDATINSSSCRQGLVEAGDKGSSAVLDKLHDDDDVRSSASTELTLGRPDPTSVHWKFSRRLLQT